MRRAFLSTVCTLPPYGKARHARWKYTARVVGSSGQLCVSRFMHTWDVGGASHTLMVHRPHSRGESAAAIRHSAAPSDGNPRLTLQIQTGKAKSVWGLRIRASVPLSSTCQATLVCIPWLKAVCRVELRAPRDAERGRKHGLIPKSVSWRPSSGSRLRSFLWSELQMRDVDTHPMASIFWSHSLGKPFRWASAPPYLVFAELHSNQNAFPC